MDGRRHCLLPLVALAIASLLAACSTETAPTGEEEPPAATEAAEEESPPAPTPEQAQAVKDLVRGWVDERSAGEGVYDIPPRGGHDVAGTLAEFHTVKRADADTYSVCVDFKSEADTYDVDFIVDESAEGLAVSDHYLHKINGEAVE